MCGIVAHIGPSNSVKVVMEGLKRLEYRGYDSAGVSYLDRDGGLKILKKEGKLERLKESLGDLSQYNAFSCIGHTRWATHGEVSDANSHPHTNGQISLVHNGIIENSNLLRDQIEKQGRKFHSETDSEIFLALVEREREKGKDIIKSVIDSFKKLKGNSAFVIIDSKTGDIFALKKGAPLVCGIHSTNFEALISSDPYALVGVIDEIYFPEDNVLCHLSTKNRNLMKFYELNSSPSKRWTWKKQDHLSLQDNDKGTFEHFMLKEIYEQPRLIQDLSNYYFEGEGNECLKEMSRLNPKLFLIVACGTAYYAGMIIGNFFANQRCIPCIVDLASEFRYKNPLVNKNEDLALFVSQSGETADTLAAQQLCKDLNLKTVSIVNVEDSTLYRVCEKNLLIRAGVEIGVASTKAFTQQVLTGRLLCFAVDNGIRDSSAQGRLCDKFHLLSLRIDDILRRSDEIKFIAETISRYKGFFFTGRGIYYPSALEGALKLKEIAYVHAEGYASGELKHGPIALIDENMVNIAIIGPELKEKTLSNVQEIKARKGFTVVLGPRGDASVEKAANYFIPLDFEGLGELSPLYVNVVNQLLAYHMAKFKGTDIDQPKNLAKSVTVE